MTGSGTKENPYLISTVTDFNDFRQGNYFANSDVSDYTYFELTNDIDYAGVYWAEEGTVKGRVLLDGKDFSIKNVVSFKDIDIENPPVATYSCFHSFKTIDEIRNLSLKNFDIKILSSENPYYGYFFLFGFCTYDNFHFINCSFKVNKNNAYKSNEDKRLIAYIMNNSSIENCTFDFEGINSDIDSSSNPATIGAVRGSGNKIINNTFKYDYPFGIGKIPQNMGSIQYPNYSNNVYYNNTYYTPSLLIESSDHPNFTHFHNIYMDNYENVQALTIGAEVNIGNRYPQRPATSSIFSDEIDNHPNVSYIGQQPIKISKENFNLGYLSENFNFFTKDNQRMINNFDYILSSSDYIDKCEKIEDVSNLSIITRAGQPMYLSSIYLFTNATGATVTNSNNEAIDCQIEKTSNDLLIIYVNKIIDPQEDMEEIRISLINESNSDSIWVYSPRGVENEESLFINNNIKNAFFVPLTKSSMHGIMMIVEALPLGGYWVKDIESKVSFKSIPYKEYDLTQQEEYHITDLVEWLNALYYEPLTPCNYSYSENTGFYDYTPNMFIENDIDFKNNFPLTLDNSTKIRGLEGNKHSFLNVGGDYSYVPSSPLFLLEGNKNVILFNNSFMFVHNIRRIFYTLKNCANLIIKEDENPFYQNNFATFCLISGYTIIDGLKVLLDIESGGSSKFFSLIEGGSNSQVIKDVLLDGTIDVKAPGGTIFIWGSSFEMNSIGYRMENRVQINIEDEGTQEVEIHNGVPFYVGVGYYDALKIKQEVPCNCLYYPFFQGDSFGTISPYSFGLSFGDYFFPSFIGEYTPTIRNGVIDSKIRLAHPRYGYEYGGGEFYYNKDIFSGSSEENPAFIYLKKNSGYTSENFKNKTILLNNTGLWFKKQDSKKKKISLVEGIDGDFYRSNGRTSALSLNIGFYRPMIIKNITFHSVLSTGADTTLEGYISQIKNMYAGGVPEEVIINAAKGMAFNFSYVWVNSGFSQNPIDAKGDSERITFNNSDRFSLYDLYNGEISRSIQGKVFVKEKTININKVVSPGALFTLQINETDSGTSLLYKKVEQDKGYIYNRGVFSQLYLNPNNIYTLDYLNATQVYTDTTTPFNTTNFVPHIEFEVEYLDDKPYWHQDEEKNINQGYPYFQNGLDLAPNYSFLYPVTNIYYVNKEGQ